MHFPVIYTVRHPKFYILVNELTQSIVSQNVRVVLTRILRAFRICAIPKVHTTNEVCRSIFKQGLVDLAYTDLKSNFRGCLRSVWPQRSYINSLSFQYYIRYNGIFICRLLIGHFAISRPDFASKVRIFTFRPLAS